jgi:hypothetical protein
VKAIRVPDGKRISNSRLKAPKGDLVTEAVAAGEDQQGGSGARLDLQVCTCVICMCTIEDVIATTLRCHAGGPLA